MVEKNADPAKKSVEYDRARVKGSPPGGRMQR